MVPLIVLLVSFAVFRLAGFGVAYFAEWQHALRGALGVMFLSVWPGKRRPDLVRMVPRGLERRIVGDCDRHCRGADRGWVAGFRALLCRLLLRRL